MILQKRLLLIKLLKYNKEVESAIRFSFSYENTKEEVDYTINVLKKSLMFLRRVKR